MRTSHSAGMTHVVYHVPDMFNFCSPLPEHTSCLYFLAEPSTIFLRSPREGLKRTHNGEVVSETIEQISTT